MEIVIFIYASFFLMGFGFSIQGEFGPLKTAFICLLAPALVLFVIGAKLFDWLK